MEISGGQVEKEYFSLTEANAMIPYLENVFTRIIQLQHHIHRFYLELEEIGFAPLSESFDIHGVDAPRGVIRHRSTLKGLIEAIRDELQQIHRKGAIVKEVERGLVDWYARRRNGDEIFLCWEIGEERVKYWHPLESGYQGRRPIDEIDLS